MWWPSDLKTWSEVIVNSVNALEAVAALISIIVGGLWVYTRFVIERGSSPAVQFDIELKSINEYKDKKVLEFLPHLKNIGGSTLIVKNLRFDLLYLVESENEGVKLFDHGLGKRGKVIFPNSLRKDLLPEPNSMDQISPVAVKNDKTEHAEGSQTRGIAFIDHNTFVLPGVDQAYTFTTALPQKAAFALAWASFEYEIKLTNLNARILRISRRLGLIQYSLTHVNEPHTCERVFRI